MWSKVINLALYFFFIDIDESHDTKDLPVKCRVLPLVFQVIFDEEELVDKVTVQEG